jgi:serine/threonine protein kinase
MVSEPCPVDRTKTCLLTVVLLGRSLELEYISEYPTVKLCDWGLATPTDKRGQDPRNPKRFYGMGTRIWEPPEQKYHGEYFRKWHSRIAVRKGQRITSEHTTWQMAAVVFCMITVSRPQFGITKGHALTSNS